ncbi:hypothetical protein DSCA_61940 [Desulfosarcina alkanivorans]|uniref:Impact N-terminal domain-containing protein n=1 Tax=Desulfosarcina alkanivorans TaxID=571177 RepID=A0A5K7Z1A2_9BACT|nr:YigZ family protein [Desulfosarcina alkanivorans]BBO72264.1 hypothetical protein DSCA_61940 [Desulfosarcina alkanivorans]
MYTLTQEAVFREEIKKSRFIARAASVSSPGEAAAFLERIREARATHHCWAYRIGPKYRFSDDGEPGGTAGKPILNAIEKQDIDGVMVVVIRYYGGVKLGAGGLARAYGGCSAKCLQGARLKRIVPMAHIKLRIAFDHIGALYAIIDRFGATKLGEAYTDTGLDIQLKVGRADCKALVAALTDASAGTMELLSGC